MSVVKSLQEIKNRFEIVGNSPLLNRAIEIATKVSPTDMNVLINGESGVGKENFSKIIHTLSKRRHNPFIAINCGALPEGTIDSELFGHEKGSFTSAIDTRKGYFETVNGGTIFLDEIGELPLETQSRLLRLLENGEFLKVGSSKVQKTDVRVVAATNKDLLELTRNGKFREDLYYRLSSVTIKIPNLRERKEDIPMLWAKFVNEVADKYRIPPIDVTPDAMMVLQNFPWPGNIRQLKHFAEQLSVLESDREINAAIVQKYLPSVPGNQMIPLHNGDFNQSQSDRELLYKLFFELKKDINELKNIILGGRGSMPNTSVIHNENSFSNPYLLESSKDDSFYTKNQDEVYHPIPYDESEEFSEIIEHESVQDKEGLSLSKQEKNMIIKALNKHRGKRKLAAQDLGISERTLYRKLKEYELE